MPSVACSGFESTETKSCEQKLIRGLKSPSSYKRVQTDTWDKEISPAKLAGSYFGPDFLSYEKQLLDELKGHRVAIRHVSIKYDADNIFGASLRDSYYCNFVAVDGELYSLSAAYETKWSQHIDDIVANKTSQTVKNGNYKEPLDVTDPDYDPFPSSGIELPPY